MDHVDAHNGVGIGERPIASGGIELERRKQVERTFGLAPSSDGVQRIKGRVARLPAQTGQSAREVDRVLAGAAGHFEHEAGIGQFLAQYGKDRLAIAQRGRRVLAGIRGHLLSLEEAPLNRLLFLQIQQVAMQEV